MADRDARMSVRADGAAATAFLDDAPALWRRELDGIAIHPPQRLPELIDMHQVEQVMAQHRVQVAASPTRFSMVRLIGLSLRDARNPDGDIEIQCTGLRPCEKLDEELLIDADSEPTAHPLIYRARERTIPQAELWPQLDALEAAMSQQDEPAALELLARLVLEGRRDGAAAGATGSAGLSTASAD
jgi:FlaA1/EpsC-like NDP-sugar epimerase